MIMNLKKAGEAGAPIKKIHFGPHKEFWYLQSEDNVGKFFIVPKGFALAFELWQRNRRREAVEFSLPYPSGKVATYRLR